ncbi:hypothetical protein RQP54_08410 [Curvibacter sp. APW13]|uniref:hypothetical protein n=1 Tax=Curvibacter sp. APW13 TaxID=3077236 RepID=UPI0028DDB746|nr:hypothetical protein [Curvibacter sp. APW13]MDT8990886.1 hypothetical protein [Curvibacter sp. APW13]
MQVHHEIRFQSLFSEGRALSFPCDTEGHVDLNALSPLALDNYLFARATVGREYAPAALIHSVEEVPGASGPWPL